MTRLRCHSSIEHQFTTPDAFVSFIGWLTASVSDTTIALAEDGEVLGPGSLKWGIPVYSAKEAVMITGMHHVGVVVKDLERTIEFYRDAMGLQLLSNRERSGNTASQLLGYEDTHVKIADMSTRDDHVFHFLQYLNPPQVERPTEERNVRGATHLAFAVDDIEETYHAIIGQGATKLNPPVEVAPGTWMCYLQDPDGNWIELVSESGR